MSYVFKKEVIDMTYKQNENSKTSLNNILEKIILQNKKPSSLKLHDLGVGHTTVNMTERYVKACQNFSRLEPSCVKPQDLKIDHMTVNMTEQYILKALLNCSRSEAFQPFFLPSSSKFTPMSASQFRHEHAHLYLSEMLKNNLK